MKKLLIIFFLSFSILFLFGFWQTVQAVDLLLHYPAIPQAGEIGEASTFPEIIKYIYMFALGAAGFIALLAILIGAIMYIFSAGNPSKATDAKDRIMSALLGILILLASVLLLRTINPDLVNIGFVLPEITPTEGEGGEPVGLKIKCVCAHETLPPVIGGCYTFANRQECIDICQSACDDSPGYTLKCKQNYPGCE